MHAVEEGRKLATSTFQTRLATWKKNPNTPGHSSKLWKIMSGKKSEFGTSIPEDQLVAHFNSLLFKSQPLNFLPPDPPILNPFLDTPFTETEVLQVIRSKSPSSAPGADQLQYSFWKSVADDPESLTQLTKLFNHTFESGKVPADWHSAVVTMLYKGKGPRNLPTNFRAISLTDLTKNFRITACIQNFFLGRDPQINFLPPGWLSLTLFHIRSHFFVGLAPAARWERKYFCWIRGFGQGLSLCLSI